MRRFWWLPLVRGIIALIIGVLILGWPQMAAGPSANFIAMYWLSSGFLSLQWGMSTHQKKGSWLILGLLGMVVGLAILLRPVYVHYLAPELAIKVFGLVALFEGLARIFAGEKTGDRTHERVVGQLLLSLFEIGLGLLLFFLGELEPYTKALAGGWMFIGGILFILQSLQIRRAKPAHAWIGDEFEGQ